MDRLSLSAEELRVLGCLVEKQLTTPQQYPLTLNALTLACNQSSNRDPVLSLSERTVEAAVTSAKARGLARFVHPSHGRSALRFRHVLDEALDVGGPQLALLSVLILRGPQTPGELRARTERMAEFPTPDDVEDELGAMAGRESPLVARLPRRPGHKEDRFIHLLGTSPSPTASPEVAPDEVAPDEVAPDEVAPDEVAPNEVLGENSGPGARVGSDDLRAAVEDLQSQVHALRRDLDELRAQLGA